MRLRSSVHFWHTGIEYNVANLPSAAASHFLYDWLGLWAFLEVETGAQWALDFKARLQQKTQRSDYDNESAS